MRAASECKTESPSAQAFRSLPFCVALATVRRVRQGHHVDYRTMQMHAEALEQKQQYYE